MIKYICDLCKKETSPDRYFKKYLVIGYSKSCEDTNFDLCEECVEKVCDFLDENTSPECYDDLKHSGIKGVRYDRKSGNWEAHIRFKNVEYQLGYHGKAEDGLISAIAARAEAVQVRDNTPENFDEWYSEKYPEYTPIDRKMRGYSH